MPLDDIKNFIAVSDRLGTAGQPSEAQMRDVAEAGFDVVVNLGLLDPFRSTSTRRRRAN